MRADRMQAGTAGAARLFCFKYCMLTPRRAEGVTYANPHRL
jgi:hypothetical protein